MSKPSEVAVLVGSLRKDSINRKLAKALISLAPPSLVPGLVELADLTLFNQDLETNPPASWVRFREAISGADAVLFVTAEYNRSVPGMLKNAIDIGSRPYGHSVWNGKPAAIVSASPGAIGAFGANHHLRQSLVFLNMPVLQQPEAYIGHADKLFGADGGLVDETSRTFLRSFMQAFADWIATQAGH